MHSPGTVIGDKYRLEEQIGEGGMATVWRAIHTTLNRSVAIKFVELAGPESESQRDRFLREAQLLASIRHRCVVDIVDFGQMEDGQPYMIMEHLVGETLGDRMDREPSLGVEEIVRIFDMVLGGLAAIHEKGIVHRDLKPDNIFLLKDAEGILPKLMDFGISLASSRESQRPPGLQPRPVTQQGVILGTPTYMSPEQARGLADVDQRSDVFSMGVMLYEALASRPPFEADAVGDLLIKVIRQDAVPLSELGIDKSLSEVVEMAMAKDPEVRLHSAREMRMAIRAATRLSLSYLYGSHEITTVGARAFVEERSSSTPNSDGRRSSRPDAFVPVPLATKEESAAQASAPPRGRHRRWRIFLLAVLAVAGLAAAIFLGFEGWTPRGIREALEEPATSPWSTPAEALLDPSVSDAGADANAAPEPRELTDDDAGVRDVAVDTMLDTVTVELVGVPDNATVLLDGEPTGSDLLTLDKDGAVHAIEVTAPRRIPWTTEHQADTDGVYEVELRLRRRPAAMRMRTKTPPMVRR